MNELQLTLTADPSPWISGERRTFAASLRNLGAERPVPDPMSRAVLWLHLTDLATGTTRNHRQGDARRDRTPERRHETPMTRLRPLEAGGEILYTVSTDSHLRHLPEPGRWRIEVSLRWDEVTVRSNPIDVLVVPMSPRRLHSLFVVSAQALRQVTLHVDDRGVGLLLMGQSVARLPGDLAFRRILGDLSEHANIAMAISTFGDLHHLYAAALDRGVLRIGTDAGKELFRTDIDLPSAQLHPLGWQTDHGSMEFVLLGGTPGSIQLLIVNASQRTGALQVQRVPLPVPAVPALWRVRRRVDRPAFQLVFAAGPAVWRMDISAAAPARPLRMAASHGPACALAMYPLQGLPAGHEVVVPPGLGAFAKGAPEDACDVVFGPYVKDGDNVVSLCRIRLDTDTPPAEEIVRLPDAAPTGDWLLSQTNVRPLLAAWRSGDQILGTASSGRLDPLAGGLTDARLPELFGGNGGYGLAWVSAGGSPRFTPLR